MYVHSWVHRKRATTRRSAVRPQIAQTSVAATVPELATPIPFLGTSSMDSHKSASRSYRSVSIRTRTF